MKKLLLALFCAIPFFAFPQSNYKAGSVTTNDGSVLPGYINYREWIQNPKNIQFKINLSDTKSRQFTAPDLNGFMINDIGSYLTYMGTISMNHTHFPDLPTGVDSTSIKGTVFLRQLVIGQYVNLYSYTDSIKTRYFVQEKQKQPVELLYQNYYSNESRTQVRMLKSYTGYLVYLTGKYQGNDSGLLNSIEHLEYNSTIIKLINKINGENTSVVKSNSSISGVRYYIGAAYNQNKFNFNIPGAGSVKLSRSAPALNLGVDILSNKSTQKFFFRTDLTLSYNQIKYTRNFGPFHVVNGYPQYIGDVAYIYTANLLSASITPQIGWSFYNTDELKLYADLGAGLTLSQYANQKMEKVTNGGPGTPVTSYNFGSTRFGVPLQIGAVFNNRYEVYASYEHYGSLTSTDIKNYSLTYNTIAVGIHWLLSGQ